MGGYCIVGSGYVMVWYKRVMYGWVWYGMGGWYALGSVQEFPDEASTPADPLPPNISRLTFVERSPKAD